jgi:hypothetical protein
MELIKWLINKDNDNTPSIVIVIIVVCVVVFETTVLLKMFLPIWFQKKDDSKPSAKKPEVKNVHLVKIFTRLEEIEKRLDAQYEFIRDAVLKSGVAILGGQGVPFVELVEAALMNIMLGANGNTRDKLLAAIMKESNGRIIYQSILSSFIRKHEKNITNHFKETITWIEKRIEGGY